MLRARSPLRAALVLGAVLSWTSGCEPVDASGFGDIPASLSNRICYADSDCTGNACCGQGTNPTHVEDGPDCSNVRCTGECPVDSIDCGRCLVLCKDAHCAAACSG